MTRKKLILGSLTAVMVMAAVTTTTMAMPSDIREAVSEEGYDPYAHTNGGASYDDSELMPVGADYVATAQAMIRQSPFGDILDSTTPGETYYVVGECPDCMWYKISGNTSGYVYASYLVPASEYNTGTNSNSDHGRNIRPLDMLMDVTGASSVNVRTAPSTSGSIIGVVKEGDEVLVTGNVLDSEWYQCEYNGETAYICDDYLAPEFPQTMSCTVRSFLNIHDAADGNANIIGTLVGGDVIKASADENGWLRFSLSDGRIGYVSDEYMAAVQ